MASTDSPYSNADDALGDTPGDAERRGALIAAAFSSPARTTLDGTLASTCRSPAPSAGSAGGGSAFRRLENRLEFECRQLHQQMHRLERRVEDVARAPPLVSGHWAELRGYVDGLAQTVHSLVQRTEDAALNGLRAGSKRSLCAEAIAEAAELAALRSCMREIEAASLQIQCDTKALEAQVASLWASVEDARMRVTTLESKQESTLDDDSEPVAAVSDSFDKGVAVEDFRALAVQVEEWGSAWRASSAALEREQCSHAAGLREVSKRLAAGTSVADDRLVELRRISETAASQAAAAVERAARAAELGEELKITFDQAREENRAILDLASSVDGVKAEIANLQQKQAGLDDAWRAYSARLAQGDTGGEQLHGGSEQVQAAFEELARVEASLEELDGRMKGVDNRQTAVEEAWSAVCSKLEAEKAKAEIKACDDDDALKAAVSSIDNRMSTLEEAVLSRADALTRPALDDGVASLDFAASLAELRREVARLGGRQLELAGAAEASSRQLEELRGAHGRIAETVAEARAAAAADVAPLRASLDALAAKVDMDRGSQPGSREMESTTGMPAHVRAALDALEARVASVDSKQASMHEAVATCSGELEGLRWVGDQVVALAAERREETSPRIQATRSERRYVEHRADPDIDRQRSRDTESRHSEDRPQMSSSVARVEAQLRDVLGRSAEPEAMAMRCRPSDSESDQPPSRAGSVAGPRVQELAKKVEGVAGAVAGLEVEVRRLWERGPSSDGSLVGRVGGLSVAMAKLEAEVRQLVESGPTVEAIDPRVDDLASAVEELQAEVRDAAAWALPPDLPDIVEELRVEMRRLSDRGVGSDGTLVGRVGGLSVAMAKLEAQVREFIAGGQGSATTTDPRVNELSDAVAKLQATAQGMEQEIASLAAKVTSPPPRPAEANGSSAQSIAALAARVSELGEGMAKMEASAEGMTRDIAALSAQGTAVRVDELHKAVARLDATSQDIGQEVANLLARADQSAQQLASSAAPEDGAVAVAARVADLGATVARLDAGARDMALEISRLAAQAATLPPPPHAESGAGHAREGAATGVAVPQDADGNSAVVPQLGGGEPLAQRLDRLDASVARLEREPRQLPPPRGDAAADAGHMARLQMRADSAASSIHALQRHQKQLYATVDEVRRDVGRLQGRGSPKTPWPAGTPGQADSATPGAPAATPAPSGSSLEEVPLGKCLRGLQLSTSSLLPSDFWELDQLQRALLEAHGSATEDHLSDISCTPTANVGQCWRSGDDASRQPPRQSSWIETEVVSLRQRLEQVAMEVFTRLAHAEERLAPLERSCGEVSADRRISVGSSVGPYSFGPVSPGQPEKSVRWRQFDAAETGVPAPTAFPLFTGDLARKAIGTTAQRNPEHFDELRQKQLEDQSLAAFAQKAAAEAPPDEAVVPGVATRKEGSQGRQRSAEERALAELVASLHSQLGCLKAQSADTCRATRRDSRSKDSAALSLGQRRGSSPSLPTPPASTLAPPEASQKPPAPPTGSLAPVWDALTRLSERMEVRIRKLELLANATGPVEANGDRGLAETVRILQSEVSALRYSSSGKAALQQIEELRMLLRSQGLAMEKRFHGLPSTEDAEAKVHEAAMVPMPATVPGTPTAQRQGAAVEGLEVQVQELMRRTLQMESRLRTSKGGVDDDAASMAAVLKQVAGLREAFRAQAQQVEERLRSVPTPDELSAKIREELEHRITQLEVRMQPPGLALEVAQPAQGHGRAPQGDVLLKDKEVRRQSTELPDLQLQLQELRASMKAQLAGRIPTVEDLSTPRLDRAAAEPLEVPDLEHERDAPPAEASLAAPEPALADQGTAKVEERPPSEAPEGAEKDPAPQPVADARSEAQAPAAEEAEQARTVTAPEARLVGPEVGASESAAPVAATPEEVQAEAEAQPEKAGAGGKGTPAPRGEALEKEPGCEGRGPEAESATQDAGEAAEVAPHSEPRVVDLRAELRTQAQMLEERFACRATVGELASKVQDLADSVAKLAACITSPEPAQEEIGDSAVVPAAEARDLADHMRREMEELRDALRSQAQLTEQRLAAFPNIQELAATVQELVKRTPSADAMPREREAMAQLVASNMKAVQATALRQIQELRDGLSTQAKRLEMGLLPAVDEMATTMLELTQSVAQLEDRTLAPGTPETQLGGTSDVTQEQLDELRTSLRVQAQRMEEGLLPAVDEIASRMLMLTQRVMQLEDRGEQEQLEDHGEPPESPRAGYAARAQLALLAKASSESPALQQIQELRIALRAQGQQLERRQATEDALARRVEQLARGMRQLEALGRAPASPEDSRAGRAQAPGAELRLPALDALTARVEELSSALAALGPEHTAAGPDGSSLLQMDELRESLRIHAAHAKEEIAKLSQAIEPLAQRVGDLAGVVGDCLVPSFGTAREPELPAAVRNLQSEITALCARVDSIEASRPQRGSVSDAGSAVTMEDLGGCAVADEARLQKAPTCELSPRSDGAPSVSDLHSVMQSQTVQVARLEERVGALEEKAAGSMPSDDRQLQLALPPAQFEDKVSILQAQLGGAIAMVEAMEEHEGVQRTVDVLRGQCQDVEKRLQLVERAQIDLQRPAAWQMHSAELCTQISALTVQAAGITGRVHRLEHLHEVVRRSLPDGDLQEKVAFVTTRVKSLERDHARLEDASALYTEAWELCNTSTLALREQTSALAANLKEQARRLDELAGGASGCTAFGSPRAGPSDGRASASEASEAAGTTMPPTGAVELE